MAGPAAHHAGDDAALAQPHAAVLGPAAHALLQHRLHPEPGHAAVSRRHGPAGRAGLERHLAGDRPQAAPHHAGRRRHLGRRPAHPRPARRPHRGRVLELQLHPRVAGGRAGGRRAGGGHRNHRAHGGFTPPGRAAPGERCAGAPVAGRARPVLRRLAVAAGRQPRRAVRGLPALAPRGRRAPGGGLRGHRRVPVAGGRARAADRAGGAAGAVRHADAGPARGAAGQAAPDHARAPRAGDRPGAAADAPCRRSGAAMHGLRPEPAPAAGPGLPAVPAADRRRRGRRHRPRRIGPRPRARLRGARQPAAPGPGGHRHPVGPRADLHPGQPAVLPRHRPQPGPADRQDLPRGVSRAGRHAAARHPAAGLPHGRALRQPREPDPADHRRRAERPLLRVQPGAHARPAAAGDRADGRGHRRDPPRAGPRQPGPQPCRAAAAAGARTRSRPRQGRVPGHAGARAAQPAGAHRQRAARDGAQGRRRRARARGHRTPGQAHDAAGRRPAGRVAHRARPHPAGAHAGARGRAAAACGRDGAAAGGAARAPARRQPAVVARAVVGRLGAAGAGDHQPADQRRALHAARRAHPPVGAPRGAGAGDRGGRQRHGHRPRAAARRVRRVLPGPEAGHRPVARRAGPGPGAGQEPGGAAWRRGRGAQRRARPGQPLRGAPAAARTAGAGRRGLAPGRAGGGAEPARAAGR